MIAPTGGVSIHGCEAHLIWCNRGGEDIRNLHVGSRVEISVKVIGTAACFVASRPDPQHLSAPLQTVTSTVYSVAVVPSIILISLPEFRSTVW